MASEDHCIRKDLKYLDFTEQNMAAVVQLTMFTYKPWAILVDAKNISLSDLN